MTVSDASRLERLLDFLELDPANPALLADAALAAFDSGHRELTQRLIARRSAHSPLPPALDNAAGVIALADDRLAAAREHFNLALEKEPNQPAVGFNLAWTLARLGDWPAVVKLIDEAMAASVPRAAALKVHALHMLDQTEDALAWGMVLVERRPDDTDLLGAVALAAMDVEDWSLAATFAERAGEASPAGLATRGFLALERQDAAKAMSQFESALAIDPRNARAHLGLGLVHLVEERPAAAAGELDQAATMFEGHPGSWIAAGWAYYGLGEVAKSRQRFERAVALDSAFSEGHGGLAVLDIAEGQIEAARRRTEVALRLDRASLSGLLAKSQLLALDGAPETGEQLRQRVIHTPMNSSGPSIAQALMRFRRRRRV